MRSTLATLFLFLSACGGPESDTMARDLTLTARGLYDNPNPLSEVPDGAFSRADDVVVRRPGMVETRRGFVSGAGTLGVSGDRFDALGSLNGVLIGHTTSGVLGRYDGTTWTPYTGTFLPPAGRRMRFLPAAKSLYFTTNKGVQRIDETTGAVLPAGVPQALAGTATLTGSSGFLPINSAVAYRYVWGYRNANDRVILGAPSSRVTVANSMLASSSANVQQVVPVPSWVTEDYFLQVYRSDVSAASNITPGDDMGLVYEAYPTAAQITARSWTLPVDVTPDEIKGQYLYSSPNAGTPGSEKFQPPVCVDMVEYKERVWMGCTTQRQRLQLTLLSADGTSGGMKLNDQILFTQDGVTDRYVAATFEDQAVDGSLAYFKLFSDGTPAQNIEATARSLARVINKRTGGTGSFVPFLYAYYGSDEYTSPGLLVIESRQLGAQDITVFAYQPSDYWVPSIGYEVRGTLSRTGTTVTYTSGDPHGFTVGERVRLDRMTNPADAVAFPSGMKTVTSVADTKTFTYIEAGTSGSSLNSAVFQTWEFGTPFSDDDAPNSIVHAEIGEPDAVPLSGYIPIGSANHPVLRMMVLGDSLMIYKDEGTWMLNGDSPETFNARKFPNAARLVAPDTLVGLGTQHYGLTDQGVMSFTESGARVLSAPIEGRIKDLVAGDPALAAKVRSLAFGVGYETEKEYWLFLPSAVTDTACTQAYVYNYVTGAWTHWTKPATIGHVLDGQDKAYLGSTTTNGVLVERKTRTAADYQDETGQTIQAFVDWQVRAGDDAGAYKQWVKGAALFEQPDPNIPVSSVPVPDSIILSCRTELAPTPISGPFAPQGMPYVSTYIPTECSRSQVLTFGVSAGQAGRRLSLRGLSVDYVTSSTKLR